MRNDPCSSSAGPSAQSNSPSSHAQSNSTKQVPTLHGDPSVTVNHRSYVFNGSHEPTTNESSGNDNLPRDPKQHNNRTPWWLRAVRSVIRFVMILTAIVIFLGIAVVLIGYTRIASTLPSVDDLQAHASKFETTQILDREGNLLYEIIDPSAGRREYVKIDDISPFMVAAIVATEDKDFYSHPGFDLIAIARATIQNLSAGETVSGASTITQQLARNLLLDASERNERTIQRKIKEIFLAAEITRRYNKDQILELYLNENYYGNFAYGIEAASMTYFGVPAKFLNLAQSSFLAGLPQAPSLYNVHTNYSATLERQKTVITLMYLVSREQGCIAVGNSSSKVCVGAVDVSNAIAEIERTNFEQPNFSIKYPHWVTLVREQLVEKFGAQSLYEMGLTVYTTINPELQEIAQQIVSEQVAALAANNTHGGALVAMDVKSGQILAMVGSPDFSNEEKSGQVNMAVALRQPGSTLKPIVYAAAFEKGWTPATLVWDVPTDFSPTGKPEDLLYAPPYSPVNYDNKFRGPVLVRDALANSYNIPAVKALEYVGIYEDPDRPGTGGFVQFAQRFGLKSLDKPGWGLSIALGGGEVSLLDMTTAFNVLANEGLFVKPSTILRVIDRNGVTIYETDTPERVSVLAEEYAYQITSILSDRIARAPIFGSSSVLDQPFEVAVKTGTTNDFRDNLTIGYTPGLTVGVWVGNPDYTPMVSSTGLTGAAPIWSQFMGVAVPKLTNGVPQQFRRPPGITDQLICSLSGTMPSDDCGERRWEIFANYQLPLPASEDLLQKTWVNTWTGLRANEHCPNGNKEVTTVNIQDEAAQRWVMATREGHDWAVRNRIIREGEPVYFTPKESCQPGQSVPNLSFVNIGDGSEITGDSVDLQGIVSASDGVQSVSVEFGRGEDPGEWYVIESLGALMMTQPGHLATWHTGGLENGIYTLRLIAVSPIGTTSESRVRVRMNREERFEGPIVPTEQVPVLVPDYYYDGVPVMLGEGAESDVPVLVVSEGHELHIVGGE